MRENHPRRICFSITYCSQIKDLSLQFGHSKQEKLPWSGHQISDSVIAALFPKDLYTNLLEFLKAFFLPIVLLSHSQDSEHWCWRPPPHNSWLQMCYSLNSARKCLLKAEHTNFSCFKCGQPWQTWSWQTCSRSSVNWTVSGVHLHSLTLKKYNAPERVISVILRRNTPDLPSQGSRTGILLLTLFFSTGKRQMLCWQLLPSISAPYSLSKVKLIKSLLKGCSGSCDNYFRLGCVIIYVILWAHRAAATFAGSSPALDFHKNLIITPGRHDWD